MTYEARETSEYGGQPVELYRFTKGATVYRYTSADRNITADVGDGDELFEMLQLSRSEPEQSKEPEAVNLKVRMPRTAFVAALFRTFVPHEAIDLKVFRKHESDSEVYVFWQGRVVSAERQESEVVLTCEPILARFRRNGLQILHQTGCQHVLYDPRTCKVDRDNWKVEAEVTDIDGVEITAAEFDAEPDGYFEAGYVELASGDQRYIVKHVGDTLTLLQGFGDALEEGNTVTAFAGCKGRFQEDCIDKFGDDGGGREGNGTEHGGFPFVPDENPFIEGVE